MRSFETSVGYRWPICMTLRQRNVRLGLGKTFTKTKPSTRIGGLARSPIRVEGKH
ncbi:MAG: hypothetical protein PHV74_12880 [Dehalococcoidia bacterium]|nr:hypothetical protein [Dehalococcoidia bacterium]